MRARTYTFSGGVAGPLSKSPFSPSISSLSPLVANEEDRRRKKERDEEKDPWRVLELKTQANRPRLRLQTSRLNAYSRVPSIVDLRTTTGKNCRVQCYCADSSIAITVNLFRTTRWWGRLYALPRN